MDPISIISGVAVFVLLLVVLTSLAGDKSQKYRKKALANVSRETMDYESGQVELIEDDENKLEDALLGVPILGYIVRQLKLSGSGTNALSYIMMLVLLMAIGTYAVGSLFANTWLIGFIISFVVVLTLSNAYLGWKIDKRNKAFLDNFPDAIDVIVRSVKSGHPLLASLRMIAQSAEPPISNEFQKVIDEVSFGRPLSVALRKMADRIGILDINFFVVVLALQQETGGNLAEVLNNLSGIIRKRKQMRLKIRAITSEGRFTSWIFGAIPVFTMGVVQVISPDYMKPMFETNLGQALFFGSFGMIALAIYLSRKLCNIEL